MIGETAGNGERVIIQGRRATYTKRVSQTGDVGSNSGTLTRVSQLRPSSHLGNDSVRYSRPRIISKKVRYSCQKALRPKQANGSEQRTDFSKTQNLTKTEQHVRNFSKKKGESGWGHMAESIVLGEDPGWTVKSRELTGEYGMQMSGTTHATQYNNASRFNKVSTRGNRRDMGASGPNIYSSNQYGGQSGRRADKTMTQSTMVTRPVYASQVRGQGTKRGVLGYIQEKYGSVGVKKHDWGYTSISESYINGLKVVRKTRKASLTKSKDQNRISGPIPDKEKKDSTMTAEKTNLEDESTTKKILSEVEVKDGKELEPEESADLDSDPQNKNQDVAEEIEVEVEIEEEEEENETDHNDKIKKNKAPKPKNIFYQSEDNTDKSEGVQSNKGVDIGSDFWFAGGRGSTQNPNAESKTKDQPTKDKTEGPGVAKFKKEFNLGFKTRGEILRSKLEETLPVLRVDTLATLLAKSITDPKREQTSLPDQNGDIMAASQPPKKTFFNRQHLSGGEDSERSQGQYLESENDKDNQQYRVYDESENRAEESNDGIGSIGGSNGFVRLMTHNSSGMMMFQEESQWGKDISGIPMGESLYVSEGKYGIFDQGSRSQEELESGRRIRIIPANRSSVDGRFERDRQLEERGIEGSGFKKAEKGKWDSDDPVIEIRDEEEQTLSDENIQEVLEIEEVAEIGEDEDIISGKKSEEQSEEQSEIIETESETESEAESKDSQELIEEGIQEIENPESEREDYHSNQEEGETSQNYHSGVSEQSQEDSKSEISENGSEDIECQSQVSNITETDNDLEINENQDISIEHSEETECSQDELKCGEEIEKLEGQAEDTQGVGINMLNLPELAMKTTGSKGLSDVPERMSENDFPSKIGVEEDNENDNTIKNENENENDNEIKDENENDNDNEIKDEAGGETENENEDEHQEADETETETETEEEEIQNENEEKDDIENDNEGEESEVDIEEETGEVENKRNIDDLTDEFEDVEPSSEIGNAVGENEDSRGNTCTEKVQTPDQLILESQLVDIETTEPENNDQFPKSESEPTETNTETEETEEEDFDNLEIENIKSIETSKVEKEDSPITESKPENNLLSPGLLGFEVNNGGTFMGELNLKEKQLRGIVLNEDKMLAYIGEMSNGKANGAGIQIGEAVKDLIHRIESQHSENLVVIRELEEQWRLIEQDETSQDSRTNKHERETEEMLDEVLSLGFAEQLSLNSEDKFEIDQTFDIEPEEPTKEISEENQIKSSDLTGLYQQMTREVMVDALNVFSASRLSKKQSVVQLCIEKIKEEFTESELRISQSQTLSKNQKPLSNQENIEEGSGSESDHQGSPFSLLKLILLLNHSFSFFMAI